MTNQVAFDFTEMDTYLVCQRRYQFRFVRHLVTKARQTPLEFGRAIHCGLNEWFKTRSLDKALLAFTTDWQSQGGDWDQDLKRTEHKGKQVLRAYSRKYETEPFEILAHEKVFELPMGDRLYIGRRDRVIKWADSVKVMEHKTMSQMGYSTFNKFNPNMQIDGYIYATGREYPECYSCVVDGLLIAKTKEDFARKIETRMPSEINQFPTLFKQITDDILESTEKDRWVPNHGMCTYYGECPYRRLCTQAPEHRERSIEAEYTVSPWDPRK